MLDPPHQNGRHTFCDDGDTVSAAKFRRVQPKPSRHRPRSSLSLAAGVATGTQPAGTGDGDWPLASRDYEATRFSPLPDINATQRRRA